MTPGGARFGAGAPLKDPRLKKIQHNTKLPRWLVQWIRMQPIPAALLIERALMARHNLKAPK